MGKWGDWFCFYFIVLWLVKSLGRFLDSINLRVGVLLRTLSMPTLDITSCIDYASRELSFPNSTWDYIRNKRKRNYFFLRYEFLPKWHKICQVGLAIW